MAYMKVSERVKKLPPFDIIYHDDLWIVRVYREDGSRDRFPNSDFESALKWAYNYEYDITPKR